MNTQIRRLGIAMLVVFVALFVKLNELQVVRADDLANDPRNTRKIVKDFSQPRGAIVSADDVLLAQSVPSDGPFKVRRQYPEGDLFSHVVGFFSFSYGTEGVERSYNDELSGRSADVRVRTPQDLLVDRDRTGNVKLTISKSLQQLARQKLDERFRANGAKGSIVALDPSTGAVLAMVSNPSFDPNPLTAHNQKAVQESYNQLRANPAKPMLPRAYRETYPPGSTFKVVTSAAAIERAPDLTTKAYPVLQSLQLPRTSRGLSNFGGGSCGGQLPALLKVSCNTAFAQMGMDLGAEQLRNEANDFGFNEAVPLDLPAVARSVFPEAKTFVRNEAALARSAIGQEDVRATPLEMALIAAGVGNNGTIMKPYVVAEITDSEGGVVRTAQPAPWKQAMSAPAADTLTSIMVDVVSSGTGTGSRIPGVTVAGKTGTAQTGTGTAHAWFVAFAPAEAPKVAVAVMLEHQPEVNETTGGRLAAPIARDIIRAALGMP